MREKDQLAVVVGAASGIGRETAAAFAALFGRIVIIDMAEEPLDSLARDLSHSGIDVTAIAADVSNETDVQGCFNSIESQYGRLDVLVNSVANKPSDGLLNVSANQWDDDVAASLRGPFLTCQRTIPIMIRQGGGSIINVSSVNGIAFFGAEGYSAAKAGLINLTKAIAVRYGPSRVRANVVAPAAIKTPRWSDAEAADPGLVDRIARRYPLRRVGTPKDVASAIMFLASDDASWISGVVLPVDGGLLAGDLDRFGRDPYREGIIPG